MFIEARRGEQDRRKKNGGEGVKEGGGRNNQRLKRRASNKISKKALALARKIADKGAFCFSR